MIKPAEHRKKQQKSHRQVIPRSMPSLYLLLLRLFEVHFFIFLLALSLSSCFANPTRLTLGNKNQPTKQNLEKENLDLLRRCGCYKNIKRAYLDEAKIC